MLWLYKREEHPDNGMLLFYILISISTYHI